MPVVDDAGLLAPPANVVDDAGLFAEPQASPSPLAPLGQAAGFFGQALQGPAGLQQFATDVANNPRMVGAMAARVGLPIIGAAGGGGVPGLAAGGAAGELLGQYIEGREAPGFGEVGVGAAMAPLAFPRALTAGRGLAATTAIRGAEGGVFSAADSAARALVRGEELNPGQIAGEGILGVPLGAAFGGATRAWEGRARAAANVVDDAGLFVDDTPPVDTVQSTGHVAPEAFGGGPREGSRVVFPEQAPAPAPAAPPANVVDDAGLLQGAPISEGAMRGEIPRYPQPELPSVPTGAIPEDAPPALPAPRAVEPEVLGPESTALTAGDARADARRMTFEQFADQYERTMQEGVDVGGRRIFAGNRDIDDVLLDDRTELQGSLGRGEAKRILKVGDTVLDPAQMGGEADDIRGVYDYLRGAPDTLDVSPAPPMRQIPEAAPPAGNALDAMRAPRADTGARVYRVPLDEIHVDEQRFQTRRAYGKGGESGQLSGVQRWDDQSAGNVAVWRDPADGKLYAVDGHNRVGLARRLGQPDLRVMELDAPDASTARAQGAEINMRGGTFNEIDVATYLRERGVSTADLDELGVSLSQARNRDGAALANLHPAIFGMVERGEMPLRRGAIIGRALAPSADLPLAEAQAQQIAVAKLLGTREQSGRVVSDEAVEELISAVRATETTTGTQQTLFGEDEITMSLAVERAEVVAEVRRALRREGRLFGTAEEGAERLEQEGSKIDRDRAGAARLDVAQINEQFGRLANRTGPVGELISHAARRLSQGDPLKRVIAETLPAIRRELSLGDQAPGDSGAGGGGQGGLFGSLKNQRGSINLRDLFGRRGAAPEAEQRPRSDAPPPRGSLLANFSKRGQPAGNAPAPENRSGVLIYGPDDRPLILRGALSAHDPDKLAPTFSKNLDERLAGMNQRLAELHREDVAHARRNRVPVRQTYREADKLKQDLAAYAERNGLSERQVTAMLRRRGEAVNPAGLELLNTLNVEASVNARAAVARAKIDPTEANVEAAAEAILHLNETMLQRAGGTAEAGRTLHIARYPRGPSGNILRALSVLEREAGGRKKVDMMFALLAEIDPNDTMAINQFVRNAQTATLGDKLYEAWINGLLSGPQTHVVNAVSNTLLNATRVGERVLTAGVEAVRAPLAGRPRERFLGEAVHDVVGMLGGLKDAGRAGLRAWQTEIPSAGGSKVLETGTRYQAIKGPLGRAVRVPGRALLAADEFFKTITRRGELHAQAYRIAKMDYPKGGRRMAERMAEVLARPHEVDGLQNHLDRVAEHFTLQDPLTGFWGKLLEARNRSRIAQVLVPFMRVSVNSTKFALNRTPVQGIDLIQRWARGQVAAHGGELSEEIGRAILGAGIAAAVSAFVAEGLITGGSPRDPADRRATRLTEQPYSAKIGDKYISYARFEPLSTVVGLVADAQKIGALAEEEDAAQKIALAAATALGFNLTNKTFLRGISDMMNAISDPDRYGERWMQSLAGSTVPVGVSQAARAADPTVRKPRTLGEVFKARTGYGTEDTNKIPGIGEIGPVGPVRDIWGEPISRHGLFDGTGTLAEFAEKLVSPLYVQRAATDPASKEVARLRVRFDPPDEAVELQGKRIPLEPAERERYAQDAGRAAKAAVTKLIAGAAYGRYSDEQKSEAIRRAVFDARARVRAGIKRDVLGQMRAASR